MKLIASSSLALACTALAVSSVCAQTASWNAQKALDLDRYVANSMLSEDVPGLSLAVVLNGQVVYAKGFGVKTRGSAEAVSLSTQFRLASTGKQLATTLMAAVVDTGAVAWNTPARQVLPGLQLATPALTQSVTYSDLVCNCLGAERRDFDLILNALSTTPQSAFADLRKLQFPEPRGTFAYSNQLVAAGGWAGAIAGGGNPSDLVDAFQTQLKQRVLNPIGMSQTTASEAEVIARDDYARPHAYTLQGVRQPIPPLVDRWIDNYQSAGAIWSTTGDMAKYLITQLNRGLAASGARVVSPQNLERLWTPQVNVAPGVDYGLGLFSARYLGKRVLFHGGNLSGSTSQAFFMPEDGLAFVVLANADLSTVPDLLLNVVLRAAFDQPNYTDKQVADILIQQRTALIAGGASSEPITPSQAAPFIGTYADPKGGDLTVSYGNGRLLLNFGEFTASTLRFIDRSADPTGTGTFVLVNEAGPFPGLGFLPQIRADGKAQIIFTAGNLYTFVKQ